MSLRLLLIIILSVHIYFFTHAQSTSRFISSTFCITAAEDSLIDMINSYRQSKGIAALLPSKSLCYVAQVHSRDLYYNKPAAYPCGLHSWSDKGRWTACCYPDKEPKNACMWNKPKELAGYRGKGYELVFWEKDVTDPAEPYNMWISHDISSSMLLNWGSWKTRNWKVIGAAIYKGYTVVWFGEEADMAGEPYVCGRVVASADTVLHSQVTDQKVTGTAGIRPSSEGSTGTRPEGSAYYLIVGSFDTMGKAKSVADQYKNNGYPDAEVIMQDNKCRISLGRYTSLEQAKKAKKELEVKMPEIWIMQK